MIQKRIRSMFECNNNKFALLIIYWKDAISELYSKMKVRSKKRVNLAKKILSIPETTRDTILRNYLKEKNVIFIQKYREWQERIKAGPNEKDEEFPPPKPRYIFLPTREELTSIILKIVEEKKKVRKVS